MHRLDRNVSGVKGAWPRTTRVGSNLGSAAILGSGWGEPRSMEVRTAGFVECWDEVSGMRTRRPCVWIHTGNAGRWRGGKRGLGRRSSQHRSSQMSRTRRVAIKHSVAGMPSYRIVRPTTTYRNHNRRILRERNRLATEIVNLRSHRQSACGLSGGLRG